MRADRQPCSGVRTVRARRLKETSVKRRIACRKVMFRWLELDEVISISPFHRLDARIRLPKRLPRNLTDDEFRRLRRTAMDRVGLTGRITETKALRIARRADADAYTALVVLEVLLCTRGTLRALTPRVAGYTLRIYVREG